MERKAKMRRMCEMIVWVATMNVFVKVDPALALRPADVRAGSVIRSRHWKGSQRSTKASEREVSVTQ